MNFKYNNVIRNAKICHEKRHLIDEAINNNF